MTAVPLRPDLRVIDPRTCRDGTCADSSTAPIEVPGITDADYEGLTQVGDDLFLLVSDDRIKKKQRSVFVLLRVSGL
ncbi:MAG: hypothetical protein FJX25_17260 [Alphaproteobacteria bacterium]|nr:hypothetical protein [Alphaproteobacteria bacterium]